MRLPPADGDALKPFEETFALVEQVMGFVPNSMKAMAHNPAILSGFFALSGAVLGPENSLDPGLRQMIAYVTSSAAGCRYCQAHTAHTGHRQGVSAEKLDAVWTYETSDLFTEAERAALALAQAGGSVPNEATDAHFDALKAHYTNKEISEIVAVIAVFGFLNRWNDTLATPLEDSPIAFAEAHLTAHGWEAGNHG